MEWVLRVITTNPRMAEVAAENAAYLLESEPELKGYEYEGYEVEFVQEPNLGNCILKFKAP